MFFEKSRENLTLFKNLGKPNLFFVVDKTTATGSSNVYVLLKIPILFLQSDTYVLIIIWIKLVLLIVDFELGPINKYLKNFGHKELTDFF